MQRRRVPTITTPQKVGEDWVHWVPQFPTGKDWHYLILATATYARFVYKTAAVGTWAIQWNCS